MVSGRSIGLMEPTSKAIFRKVVRKQANFSGLTKHFMREILSLTNSKGRVNLFGRTAVIMRVDGRTI
jgi:hypothetical protein